MQNIKPNQKPKEYTPITLEELEKFVKELGYEPPWVMWPGINMVEFDKAMRERVNQMIKEDGTSMPILSSDNQSAN